MKSWPSKALLLAGAAALLVAIPAASQETPESLLPPGFGDPEALPPPAEKAPDRPASPPTAAPPVVAELPLPQIEDSAAEDLEAMEPPRPTNYFTIPEGEARAIDPVGPLQPGNFGLEANAFGVSDGFYLASLMRRLDAPLPSRWTSILLRRALLSRLQAPARIHPVDWVAARADLLLRMGEADAARILVQFVDREFYTPRMIEVAAQTALATADPSALCPIVGPARELSNEPVWDLAEAMCAALEGEPARASALADEARRQAGTPVDVLLAEKVIGAAAETRRAAQIDWETVTEINPWRFGLASATGVEIPGPLMARAGPRLQAWQARAPMLPLEQRLAAAGVAARLGVFSSNALVEIYSLMLDQTDPAEAGGTVAARLRTAWTHRDSAERVEAMRGLWDEAQSDRYSRLILTAGAAARIAPAEAFANRSRDLIASMLSAGMDRQAAQWAPVVEASEDLRAWALLAVSSPRPAVDLSPSRVSEFVDGDDSRDRRRAQLLVAALAGLARIAPEDVPDLASAAGARLDLSDRWTTAIDQAARDRQTGTVALLAAIGMQTGEWGSVPPAYLFRIVRALRTVGLEFEARMIAAEALARL